MRGFRSRTSRFAPPPPNRAESTLTVPDELLEWGRAPERVVTWSRDWAREVADLAARSLEAPLDEKATERFLSRLEALVVEAIRAGRPDLLTGLDVQTAEWLGLQYAFTLADGTPLTIGSEGQFGWSEVRVLTEAFQHATLAKQLREEGSGGDGWPEPDGLGRLAVRGLGLVREVFPSARVSEARPVASFACVACGTEEGSTRVEVDGGALYCSACWSAKTEAAPSQRAWRPPVAVEDARPLDDEAVSDLERVLERLRAEKLVRDREKRIEERKARQVRADKS